MFGLFGGKSEKKKLQKEYANLREKGVQAQRNGKMAEFADLSAKAEEVYKRIQELEKKEN